MITMVYLSRHQVIFVFGSQFIVVPLFVYGDGFLV